MPAIEAERHGREQRQTSEYAEIEGEVVAVLGAELGADAGKGGCEAAAIVGQHMGKAEGEGFRGLSQEGNGAALGLIVLDGEVDGAGLAIDGDLKVALAALATDGLQLGQVLDVDVDEAKVVVPEGSLSADGSPRHRRTPAADPSARRMRQTLSRFKCGRV